MRDERWTAAGRWPTLDESSAQATRKRVEGRHEPPRLQTSRCWKKPTAATADLPPPQHQCLHALARSVRSNATLHRSSENTSSITTTTSGPPATPAIAYHHHPPDLGRDAQIRCPRQPPPSRTELEARSAASRPLGTGAPRRAGGRGGGGAYHHHPPDLGRDAQIRCPRQPPPSRTELEARSAASRPLGTGAPRRAGGRGGGGAGSHRMPVGGRGPEQGRPDATKKRGRCHQLRTGGSRPPAANATRP